MTTVILGGGLTGLTLARLLHEQGEEVTVLEAEERYGGLCRTTRAGGFTFDTGGSHIIFSRDAGVLAFMRRMIEGNEQRNTRTSKVCYKGRFVKYPFENGLSELPVEDRFACLNGFIQALLAAGKGEAPAPKNFREWIYHTFGSGIAECYMIPYNEKIWKYPADRMSLHWVEGRIPRPPVEDVIKSAIGIPTEGYTHQALFSYPLDGGIEALVHAIAAPVQDRIRTGFTVTSVRRSATGFRIGNGSEVVEADRCICTIPLQHLIPCLEDVPSDVKAAVAGLKYTSLACVNVGFEGPAPGYSWVYVPDKALGMANRISFPSGYSRHAAPDGCSSVLAEITHHPGDEVDAMTDDELIRDVLTTLRTMGILGGADPVFTSVERQPFAYVVYDLDYQKNIGIAREYCGKAGIPLVGRFAQFEYLNMDGCIRSAMDFVKS